MPKEPAQSIRRAVLFSGRVQGVGFRYTAHSLASRFPITGFVRNLRDGRVELVVEGLRDDLDRLQEAITDAMAGNIREASVTDGAATGEFRSFDIAF